MASGREPRQVAQRALILGALAFRSSLEVTDHPRVAELSKSLLPWLTDMGCADELDPLEQEQLATPLGQLSDSQRMDVNSAGESASLFAWMLGLREPLEDTACANVVELPRMLRILKPEATHLIAAAVLRPGAEIEDACRHFVLIRSMLQEARIKPPGTEIIRRLRLSKLHDAGLVVTADAVSRAGKAVDSMTLEDRARLAGAFFVRHYAALWFFNGSHRYWE